MGQEVHCSAHVGGRTLAGKAMLETDELLFRGAERVRIRLADITKATATDGRLLVRHKDGSATFELGPAAIRWAERINHPPTLADKLGVKPGHRVALIGLDDEPFAQMLEGRGAVVGSGRLRKACDLVFLGVQRPRDLGRLNSLETSLARDGAVWVVYPKGRKDPSEGDVIGAGKAAGFIDVKVARFSDSHTALKFVIPVARR